MFSKKFIKGTEEFCTFEKHVNAPYLRKSFTLESCPKNAKITITSSGFYQLFINGRDITKGHMAPYITNPDQLLIYDEYDLAPLLTKGENAIGIILGNGIANCMGGYIWDFSEAHFRAAPAVALCLEAELENGEKLSFEADDGFKTHPSPITFDDLRCGVHYDARLEVPHWNEIGFDDSAWKNALPAMGFDSDCCLCKSEPVISQRTLKPVSIHEGRYKEVDKNYQNEPTKIIRETTQYRPEYGEDGFVYDFGENHSFVPTFTIRNSRPGQVIAFQFGEFCLDNVVDTRNISIFYPHGYAQRDVYVCRGDEVESFTVPFTYHGAQYCVVIGADKEQITKELVSVDVIHSDIAERGNFECSDPVANKLWDLIRRSDLANFVYFPTDCPHREKNGWTGDASMSAEQMTFNFATEDSYRQWLMLIRNAQRVDGALPGIVPTTGCGFKWGNGPVWDSVAVELPYQVYKYRGDISLFRENADVITRYIHYLTVARNQETGLISIGLGDWVQPGRNPGDHDAPTCETNTMMCTEICRKAALLFEKCGMKAQSVFAKTVADEFTAAVRKYLIDFSRMRVYSSTQTSQAMAIYCGIFTDAEKKAACEELVKIVARAKDHIQCGMLGTKILFSVLGECGKAELAYKLITRKDAPSYGVYAADDMRLTGLPESFIVKNDMNVTSLNHHFLGGYSQFFIKYVAGLCINPNGDNASYVEFRPRFIEGLDYAKAHYDHPKGRIEICWRREGEDVIVDVKKPDGVISALIIDDDYMELHPSNSIRRRFIPGFSGSMRFTPTGDSEWNIDTWHR